MVDFARSEILISSGSACIFCKIVEGEELCYPIYEDDKVKAILPINPLAEGHTLVIPKKHFETIYDIPDFELSRINSAAKVICLYFRDKLGIESVTLLQNNGLGTGQKVWHHHLHIIPRKQNDGLFSWAASSHLKNPNLAQIQRTYEVPKL